MREIQAFWSSELISQYAMIDTMKRALLIVDVQEGFVRDAHAGSAFAQEIVRRATSGDYDWVVATAFINPEGSLFRTQTDWHDMGPDDPDRQMVQIVQDAADDVLDKPAYGLTADMVKRFDGYAVDVCGIETDQCVLAACSALFDAGVRCRVIKDLCASTRPNGHSIGLTLLGQLLGAPSVVTADEASEL